MLKLRNSRGGSTSSAEERCISCQQLGSRNRKGEGRGVLLLLCCSCILHAIIFGSGQRSAAATRRLGHIWYFQDDKVAHKRKHSNIVNQRWSSCIHPVFYSAYCSLLLYSVRRAQLADIVQRSEVRSDNSGPCVCWENVMLAWQKINVFSTSFPFLKYLALYLFSGAINRRLFQ